MGDPNKGLYLMPRDYIGRILHGYYSIELKRRLVECIDSYKTLEDIGSAGIFYTDFHKRYADHRPGRHMPSDHRLRISILWYGHGYDTGPERSWRYSYTDNDQFFLLLAY